MRGVYASQAREEKEGEMSTLLLVEGVLVFVAIVAAIFITEALLGIGWSPWRRKGAKRS